MKHKVSELEGALLDAAVAKAEGELFELREVHEVHRCLVDGDYFEPSQASSLCSGWADAGPIIEREKIDLRHLADHWAATIGPTPTGIYSALGRTPLIAAMRAYVASKFGDEVELP